MATEVRGYLRDDRARRPLRARWAGSRGQKGGPVTAAD